MGKPKKINFELIADEHEAYVILDEVRAEYCEDTARARVTLAWEKKVNPDADGHVRLGKCVKLSDLQKRYIPYDYVIVLNRQAYNDIRFTRHMRKALIHHELLHCAPSYDNEGDNKIDEEGRLVWRVRKHDIEEFSEVVRIYGTYKRDLEKFYEALKESDKNTLFHTEEVKVGATVN